MNCDGCKYADWRRTSNGRLHPDKSGRCVYLREHPLNLKVPAAFYWTSWSQEPNPSGGFIERGRELPKLCIFKDGGKEKDR